MAKVTITRIVHACTLIDFDGTIILTDPWFSEKFAYYHGEPRGMEVADLPKLAGVIVSHAHYDHYDMHAFSVYKDKSVPIVVKRETAGLAKKVGFTQITELEPWETTEIGDVKITAVPGKHGVPEITYILQSKDTTVFFGGDSLYIPEHDELPKRFPKIDVAILAINGLHVFGKQVVMNPEDAVAFCKLVQPKLVIPTHYRFKGGPFSDGIVLKYDGTPERFVEAMKKELPEIRVEVLEPGKSTSL